MNSKPSAPDAERMRRDLCDMIVEQAAETMQAQAGASVEMIVDRLFTYAVAQAVTTAGKDPAVKALRNAIAMINRGELDNLRERRVN